MKKSTNFFPKNIEFIIPDCRVNRSQQLVSVISDDFTKAKTSAFNVLFCNLMQFSIFPLENDDPPSLGLRLLGTDQTRAHDVVGLGIGAQLTRNQTEGVFLLHELVSV